MGDGFLDKKLVNRPSLLQWDLAFFTAFYALFGEDPAMSKLGSASVSLRPFLVLKSRRCKCRPYFASTQDVVIVGFKFQHYSLEQSSLIICYCYFLVHCYKTFFLLFKVFNPIQPNCCPRLQTGLLPLTLQDYVFCSKIS